MRRKGFNLIELLIVIGAIAIAAAILFPSPRRRGENPRELSCQSNLKQIGLAFLQYAQDCDAKFPPVAVTRSGNWAGSLQPYVKGWKLFHCPSANGQMIKSTDYYFNANLGEMSQNQLSQTKSIILSGEGKGDSPTNYALQQLPEAWIPDQKSPAYRHIDRASYLFADGHVKGRTPDKITLDSPTGKNDTFLIR